MKKEELVQLGERLKKARETKKINLEKIAERTKININFLEKIEQGNFDFLPQLYVRNFLKLYLLQLGEGSDQFLNEYDSIISQEKIPVPVTVVEEPKRIKPGDQLRDQIVTLIKKFKPYLQQHHLIWLSIGAIMIFVFIYSLARDVNEDQTRTSITTLNSFPRVADSTARVLPDSGRETLVNPKKNLMLELKAIEKTWLQVSVDDSVVTEHIFDRGMISNWQAKEKFRLFIGNAAGIRLFLNGKDLGSLGNPGQVLRIDVTENGIQPGSF